MALELLLLCALIFVFIVSFCGLLQKIKQSYQRERMIAERISRRQDAQRNSGDSLAEVYVNSAYLPDIRNDSSGIFPAAPPPYSREYADPPPKYEDLLKDEDMPISIISNSTPTPTTPTVTSNTTSTEAPDRPQVHSSPPPYTISA